ncbi:hypothetical protein AB0K27_30070 [Micromonospora echinospora]|uniref:Uncharacterized protein n=1 Tax=Micromonospora echinospora TaxID=1877 RepID=A0ABR6MKA9_MICEC|nr:hypothetical protein [Micromonospora echinospora]MBB5115826.1 hypothetical protein [Micromonospora echinospora]
MASGRWVLLILMVFVGPLLWWVGVAGTTSAASADLDPGDRTLPIFVSSYSSGAMAVVGFFALINLVLVLMFVPGDHLVREGRTEPFVRAVLATVLVTAVVWFEYRFSPAAYNWSGDPDAGSLVRDHLRPWHPAAIGLWVAVHAAVAASVAVRAGTYRFSRRPANAAAPNPRTPRPGPPPTGGCR